MKFSVCFSDKCTEWLKSDLDMLKVKSTLVQFAYTHDAQIFITFTLHILRKSTKWQQIGLGYMFSTKVPWCTYTLMWAQIFFRGQSMSTFGVTGYPRTYQDHVEVSNWPWHVKGQNTPCAFQIPPTTTTTTPPAQIFVRFTQRWTAFEMQSTFCEKCTKWQTLNDQVQLSSVSFFEEPFWITD